MKSLGAKYVFDYHDGELASITFKNITLTFLSADVVSQIRAVAGSNLSRVYDAISLPDSAKGALASITSPSGGKYAAILPVDPKLSPSPNIEIVQTGAIQASNNPEIGKKSYRLLQGVLDRGLLKPNNVLLFEHGLNDVEEGFNLGRQGKVNRVLSSIYVNRSNESF